MKKLLLLLSTFILLFFTACSSPGLSGKKVKKEYFTNGQLRTEFIMDDDSEQNGFLKKYGYNGHLTSTVHIRNGVKDGHEIGYDDKKRTLWKLNYVNGRQHGKQYAYYPNGDVMIQFTYNNGIKQGPAQTYNKDGSVNKSVMYRNGKLIN